MNIVWTKFALNEVREIYTYYKFRTSVRIAKNIKKQIFSSIKNLSKYSRQGEEEKLLAHKKGEYRYILAGNYKVIYTVVKNEIFIMNLFDCRRNPEIIKNKTM
jgi:toxin ParE1/3/4